MEYNTLREENQQTTSNIPYSQSNHSHIQMVSHFMPPETSENRNVNRLPTSVNGTTEPTRFYCTTCQAEHISKVDLKCCTTETVIIFICMALISLPFFALGIECLINPPDVVVHYCPSCQIEVGRSTNPPPRQ